MFDETVSAVRSFFLGSSMTVLKRMGLSLKKRVGPNSLLIKVFFQSFGKIQEKYLWRRSLFVKLQAFWLHLYKKVNLFTGTFQGFCIRFWKTCLRDELLLLNVSLPSSVGENCTMYTRWDYIFPTCIEIIKYYHSRQCLVIKL